MYVDPLSTRADTSPGQEDEEFEDDDDEEEREKRKWPGKSGTEVARKYEVIGTVLDCEVIYSEVPVSLINTAFSPPQRD